MTREKCSWLDWWQKCEEAGPAPAPAGNADLPDLSADGGVASRYEAKENVKKRLRERKDGEVKENAE